MVFTACLVFLFFVEWQHREGYKDTIQRQHHTEATGNRQQATGGHQNRGNKGNRQQRQQSQATEATGTGHSPHSRGHRPQATGHSPQATAHLPWATAHILEATGNRGNRGNRQQEDTIQRQHQTEATCNTIQRQQGHHTEAMDTEEQPTKNIRPAAVGLEQIRPRSVATTLRQTRAMTRHEIPGTSAANNRLASTNRKRTHQDPDEHDASQSRQIQGNANKIGRSENLHQCSQSDDVNVLKHAPQHRSPGSSQRQTRSMTQECETQARCQCRRMPPYQECLQETPIFRGDTT